MSRNLYLYLKTRRPKPESAQVDLPGSQAWRDIRNTENVWFEGDFQGRGPGKIRIGPTRITNHESRIKIQKRHVLSYPHKNFNSARNSDKLNNTTAPSNGKFSSTSTGAAEFFIFLGLRVPLVFLFLVMFLDRASALWPLS